MAIPAVLTAAQVGNYYKTDGSDTTTPAAGDFIVVARAGGFGLEKYAVATGGVTQASQTNQDTAIAANKAAVIAAAPLPVVTELAKVPDSRLTVAILDAILADLNTRDETAAAVTATYDETAGTFTTVGGGQADNAVTLAAAPTAAVDTVVAAEQAAIDAAVLAETTRATAAETANANAIAAEIAATDAEQTAQDTAIAGKVNVADRVGIVRDAANAENTKWADELAIRTLIDSISTGQRLTPFAATFAALPALPADVSATKGYLTILTADDVGTGSAASPQYPAGIYISQTTQADGWAFGAALGKDILEGVIADFVDAAQKGVAKTWKAETLDERFLSKPQMLPADGATLPLNSWHAGRTGTYIIPNGVDGQFMIIDNPSNLKTEATRPSFNGRFATSSDGTILNSTLSISPNGRWRLYWDSELDGGNGAWRIHSNRALIIPLTYPQDNNLLLTRNNDYAVYNSGGATDVFTVRVPKVPSGRIRLRYDGLSTGPIRVEMQDGTVADNISFNGSVSNGYDFPTAYKGQELAIEANTTTGHWIIYTGSESTASNEPIVALAADNKPIAYKARRVTADTTLDLADVPATAGISYYIELGPIAVLTVPGLASAISHAGPNFEMIQFESTGTAGEVRLVGNEATISGEFYRQFALNGAAVNWTVPHTGEFVINENVVASTNNALITTITNTTAGGTAYTSNLNRLTNSNLSNVATVALNEGDVLSINALSGGGTTSGAHTVRIRPVGGVIKPENEPAWTERTLTVTIDGGAAITHPIYDDAGRWLFLDPGTGKRFVQKDGINGASWASSGTGTLSQTGALFVQATSADVALTLTTEVVPAVKYPKTVYQQATAGAQVTVEGLAFTIATGTTRQIMLRVADGQGNRSILFSHWWSGGMNDKRVGTQSISSSFIRFAGSSYHFTAAGHKHFFRLKDQNTGEIWFGEVMINDGYVNNVFAINYHPGPLGPS